MQIDLSKIFNPFIRLTWAEMSPGQKYVAAQQVHAHRVMAKKRTVKRRMTRASRRANRSS